VVSAEKHLTEKKIQMCIILAMIYAALQIIGIS